MMSLMQFATFILIVFHLFSLSLSLSLSIILNNSEDVSDHHIMHNLKKETARKTGCPITHLEIFADILKVSSRNFFLSSFVI